MANTSGREVYAPPVPGKSERLYPGLRDIFIHLKILTALSGKIEFMRS
ncbi:hypothetical protein [Methanosarcina sp. MSH10X1]|nr:hypothetical protein [Methanosarcina sp. MSH10X1]